jgi:hypothetical protein
VRTGAISYGAVAGDVYGTCRASSARLLGAAPGRAIDRDAMAMAGKIGTVLLIGSTRRR